MKKFTLSNNNLKFFNYGRKFIGISGVWDYCKVHFFWQRVRLVDFFVACGVRYLDNT